MFTKFKQAFNRAITSLDTHSDALKLQTELVRELKASFAAVETHVKYLAESECRELQRRGHPHKF